MKQLIISILFLCCADVSDKQEVKPKKFCYGEYNKISADEGIDCNGDTIPIKKFNREEYLKYLKSQGQ